MGWWMEDMKCINEECVRYGIVEERFFKKEEVQVCKECGQVLQKVITAVRPHISWSTWRAV